VAAVGQKKANEMRQMNENKAQSAIHSELNTTGPRFRIVVEGPVAI